MTALEEAVQLLREARSAWITDTEWDGDQYGMYQKPRGAAIVAFGARIDVFLAKLKA